jgi:hypothetical protein
MPTNISLHIILPPFLQMTTPYERLQRDSNDFKYRFLRSETQMGAGPRETTKNYGILFYLQQVFTPHHSLNPTDAAISAFLDVPCQMSLPIKFFSPQRSGRGDCAYQRAQGTWIRPNFGESVQGATQENYNPSHYPL